MSVDYVSGELFEFCPAAHPLRSLTLVSSGMIGHSDKVLPQDIIAGLDQLTELTRVRVSLQLGWNPRNEAISTLASELDDRGGGLWIL